MNSRNYLIIGGLGSIGQALINHFEDRNFIVIDKFPNTNSNVNFFQCDVSKKDQLEKIIPKLPDNLTVLYLAGNQPFSNDIEKINQSIDDNILAICNTVLILNRKIKNLIFLSSISVYGMPKTNPINEDHPISPTTLYGSEKAAAEFLITSICNRLKIPLMIIRSAQIYGINSSKNSLPHKLVEQISSKKEIKITCEPNITRDYLHFKDLIEFLSLVISNPQIGIFNVGSGKGVKISDLFKFAFKSFRKKFNENDLVEKKLEPSFHQILDISKSKSHYNFAPKFQIERWFDEQAKES